MSVFDELAKLVPVLRKYKKLAVAFVLTTAPFVAWLTAGPHPASEIVAWSTAYVLGLFGVREAKNG